MTYASTASGLAALAIAAGGCSSSGPFAGISLVGTGGDSAVDQRHYPGVFPEWAWETAIDALRGLAFQTESVGSCGSGRQAVFTVAARRGDAERAKVTLKSAGGQGTLVTIEVFPPDPALAREIHEVLKRRLYADLGAIFHRHPRMRFLRRQASAEEGLASRPGSPS
jgi:hypothetical protein